MNIRELRDKVWYEDIPHPTIPEYIEHHASIQKILKYIDQMIKEEADNENANGL